MPRICSVRTPEKEIAPSRGGLPLAPAPSAQWYPRVAEHRLVAEVGAVEHLEGPAVLHESDAVADGERLLVVAADVEEAHPPRRAAVEQAVNFDEVGGGDKVADVADDDELHPGHDGSQQLDHAPFKEGELGDGRARVDFDAEFVGELPELPFEHARLDQVFFKAAAEHEDVVRDGQILHQPAALLDDRHAVHPHRAVLVVVDELLLEIDIAVMDGQVLADQPDERLLAVGVDAHQPHDLPLEDVEVHIVQLGDAVDDPGHPFKPQDFLFHGCAPLIFTSWVMSGRVISTSVPMPAVLKMLMPYSSPKSRRMRLLTLTTAMPPFFSPSGLT